MLIQTIMPYFVIHKILKKNNLCNNVRQNMRKTSITFRCGEELKADLDKIAEERKVEGQKKNLSDTLNVILTEYVNKNKDSKE